MLNDFLVYLDQTDVSQITWAQYMEPSQQNGTGLIDLYGNARPAWHTFRFWGDLPVERVVRAPSFLYPLQWFGSWVIQGAHRAPLLWGPPGRAWGACSICSVFVWLCGPLGAVLWDCAGLGMA